MSRYVFLLILFLIAKIAMADDGRVILQSSTSTQNSGLYDYLLPRITSDTGIKVHVVAVGTGQAIKNATNCDGDLLLTHAKEDEEAFVAQGYGLYRRDVMYNDYVLIGPKTDTANLRDAHNIDDALRRIVTAKAPFISRGDNSGTHKAERKLWQRINIKPNTIKTYRESGSGMGASLTIAIEMNAYTLSDRSTWLAYGNKQNHQIIFEGTPPLFNQYGLIPINPKHCPHTNLNAALKVAEWLTSAKGQAQIAKYKVAGQQLFFPNARQVPREHRGAIFDLYHDALRLSFLMADDRFLNDYENIPHTFYAS